MKERIKELRRILGLTQQEFANKMKIPRNNIASYETGKSNPGEAFISLSCKTFGVSEEWLRYGHGAMFLDSSREQEIADYLGTLIVSDGEEYSFQKRFICALSKLSLEEWMVLEKFIDTLQNKSSSSS